MPKVSFITVTMNNRDTIESLLSSFYREVPDNFDYEYIVVDNCSKDDTVSFIASQYPAVKIIQNVHSKGFAENNNLGIAKSDGDILALINPDITFLPGSISKAVSFLQSRTDIGLMGPQLLNKDGSIQTSARRFINLSIVFYRLITLGNDKTSLKPIQNYLASYDFGKDIQEVEWVTGAAMFCKKSVLETVGGLDENYRLYIEDQDWCFQMRKHGFKVYYYTGSKLIHEHQRSSAKKINIKTWWHLKSIVYFLYKNRR